jgi:hypothetical protein
MGFSHTTDRVGLRRGPDTGVGMRRLALRIQRLLEGFAEGVGRPVSLANNVHEFHDAAVGCGELENVMLMVAVTAGCCDGPCSSGTWNGPLIRPTSRKNS